jgi:hypothetical protein
VRKALTREERLNASLVAGVLFQRKSSSFFEKMKFEDDRALLQNSHHEGFTSGIHAVRRAA